LRVRTTPSCFYIIGVKQTLLCLRAIRMHRGPRLVLITCLLFALAANGVLLLLH
jgi:hypothetical protein